MDVTGGHTGAGAGRGVTCEGGGERVRRERDVNEERAGADTDWLGGGERVRRERDVNEERAGADTDWLGGIACIERTLGGGVAADFCVSID